MRSALASCVAAIVGFLCSEAALAQQPATTRTDFLEVLLGAYDIALRDMSDCRFRCFDQATAQLNQDSSILLRPSSSQAGEEGHRRQTLFVALLGWQGRHRGSRENAGGIYAEAAKQFDRTVFPGSTRMENEKLQHSGQVLDNSIISPGSNPPIVFAQARQGGAQHCYRNRYGDYVCRDRAGSAESRDARVP